MSLKFKSRTVPYRRKRQGKTNYKARLKMASEVPRLVVRKTCHNIIVQAIKSEEGKDRVECAAHSRELLKKGWGYSRKNTPAAYLTGILIGKKCSEKGIKKAVLDLGLTRSVKASKVYAVVKGAIDAGIDVPVDEVMFPSENRIKGNHVLAYHESKPGSNMQFSKTKPTGIDNSFKDVKNKILKSEADITKVQE